jgi:hypothetical protein
MRAVGDTNADFLAEAFTILLFCVRYRPAQPDRSTKAWAAREVSGDATPEAVWGWLSFRVAL